MNILTLYNHMSKMQEGHRPSTELEGIKEPLKVRVLILSESRLSLKQFYLIRQFSQVLKLDLSHNKIASFPVGFGLSNFPQIRTLFLHHNRFSVLRNLAPVAQSASLQYLTLFGNPLEETKARHFLVNQIPSLLLMDDKIILLEERHQDFAIPSILSPQLNFPLVPFTSSNQSQDYLVTLLYQLHLLRKVFLKANPIIAIQKWWRRVMKIKHPKISQQTLRIKTQIIFPLKKQNSLQQYRSDLSRLHAQKVIVKKSNDKIILSFLQSNKILWDNLKQIFCRGNIYLSRQYCMIRSIPFQQIGQWSFIRHSQYFRCQKLSEKRGLLFFLSIHNSLVIRKNYKLIQKKPIQLNSQLCEKYNIIKSRYVSIQQKLIKKENTYHHYVIPTLTKNQLMVIVKKQYFNAQKTALSGVRINDFPILIEAIALRGRAAISIQRIWRGFKARQKVNAYEERRRKISAIKIQRWVKNLGFYHRYRFLVEVSHYLKNERDNQITLPMTSIEAIKSYSDYKQLYGHNFVIPFQKQQFSVLNTASMLTKIVFFANRNPYPQFLDLTFKSQQLADNKKSEVLQLLFKGAKSINKILDNKNLPMVRISYDSIEQTRNRKFILALKTYRMVNHQFIRSKSGQSYQISSDLIKQVNGNRIITMTYNKDQSQNKDSMAPSLQKGLRTDKSQSSLQSQAYILDEKLYLKIRYFNVKTDLSCMLLLSYPQYNPLIQQIKPQGMGRYYLGKRSLSKRYQLPSEINQSFSKISRNILSFQTAVNQKKNLNRILNTDQSHSVIQSLSHQGSAPRFQSYRRMESHDRFDRQVYPPTQTLHNEMKHQEQLLLKQKRDKIQQAKSSHRKNISYLANLRKNSLQSLRQSLHKQDQEASKSIEEARNALEQEKVRKHERIRQHFQSQSSSFQKEFLQKGIKNIRLNFHRLEKTVTIRQKASPQRSLLQPLKTQFKEFSINFEDGEGQEIETENRSRKKEKLRDALKKQIEDYASRQKTQKSSITPQQTIVNSRYPQKQIKIQKDKQAQKEKKKLRKKRLVHSVFPQQFYPLKQSQQIGFQLPKIVKK